MNKINRIKSNWRKASKDLGFKIAIPYSLTDSDGNKYRYFGHIKHFGSNKGTLIIIIKPPKFESNSELIKIADKNKYYYSELNIECELDYNKQQIIDTLNDWQYFGPAKQKPSWYTGKPWC